MLLINPSSLGDYSIHYGNSLAFNGEVAVSTLIGGKNYTYGKLPRNLIVEPEDEFCKYYLTVTNCQVKQISIYDMDTFCSVSNVYHINRADDIERFKQFIFDKNMLLNEYAISRHKYNIRMILGKRRFVILINSNILQAFLESGLHNIFTEELKRQLDLQICFLVIPDIKMTNMYIKYNCTFDTSDKIREITASMPVSAYSFRTPGTRNAQITGYNNTEEYTSYFKNKYNDTMPITNLDISWALRMLFKKKEFPSGFLHLESSLGDTCEQYFTPPMSIRRLGDRLDLRKRILYDASNSEMSFISKHDDGIIVTADSYRSSIQLLNNLGGSQIIKL